MTRIVWMAVLALPACGSEVGYCVAEADASADLAAGPGLFDEANDGVTLCNADSVARSVCNELDGTFGDIDLYEDGAEPFCTEEGFTVACPADQPNPAFYVATGEACP